MDEKSMSEQKEKGNYEKRALSIAEAARYTCVSRGTVQTWIDTGLLPFEELPGCGKGLQKFRRIRKSDLDAFLDKHLLRADTPSKQLAPQRELFLIPKERVRRCAQRKE